MNDEPAKPAKRRRLKLSLRALMVLVLIVGGGLGWVAYRARVQREAVAIIERHNGSVGYNTSWSLRGPWPPPQDPLVPDWLRRSLGPHYFDTATSVHFSGGGLPRPKSGGDEAMRAACRLPELEQLWFIKTDATDAGAERLGDLAHLKSLDLRLNHAMTALAVKDLGRLTELRELKLATLPLRDEDMGFLRSITRLESLMVAGRESTLRDAWLEHVAGLNSLEYLQLYDMAITAEGLRHLRGLANLQVLTLHAANVDRLDALGPLTRLGSLGLYGNPIDDDDLAPVQSLPKLYSLDLRKTGITDRGAAMLTTLPSLARLDLGDTAITDAALPEFAKMPKLNELLVRNTRITPAALAAFQAAQPSIRVSP